MHQQARQEFNNVFTENGYHQFVASIEQMFPGKLDFRVAESPVFIPFALKEKIIRASTGIIDTLRSQDFKQKTERAVPANQNVPNENEHTSFLAIDFAVCKNPEGELVPQLIELQGFPSIFAYQALVSEKVREHFPIADHFQYLLSVPSYAAYVQKLKDLILASHNPENVILLEIFPEKQKTRIDFAATEQMLGISTVCYTKLIREKRQLFYEKDGRKIAVKRIYNRLIIDDLLNHPEQETSYKFTDDVDVEWAGHPNWYFRISKFSMPFLKHEFVPETKFLSDYVGKFPRDLENFVLKPLFSFAGTGVQLHVTEAGLQEITDPENYILQKKVLYEPVIQAPDGLVKCEIRMMYGWMDHASEPELLISLSRLSRGEMIGVRFNKDVTWVGGSTAFFEENPVA